MYTLTETTVYISTDIFVWRHIFISIFLVKSLQRTIVIWLLHVTLANTGVHARVHFLSVFMIPQKSLLGWINPIPVLIPWSPFWSYRWQDLSRCLPHPLLFPLHSLHIHDGEEGFLGRDRAVPLLRRSEGRLDEDVRVTPRQLQPGKKQIFIQGCSERSTQRWPHPVHLTHRGLNIVRLQIRLLKQTGGA